MFAYCGNNPVLNIDKSGMRHEIGAGAVGPFNKNEKRSSNKNWCKENIGATVGVNAEYGEITYIYVCTVEIGTGYSKDFGTEKKLIFMPCGTLF